MLLKRPVFKCQMQLIAGLALCLIAIPSLVQTSYAQTPDDSRQALEADQQALNNAYQQLQQDQKTGSAAGIAIDQDKINSAEAAFQADWKRTKDADQHALAAGQQAVDNAFRQLQRDQRNNAGAAEADKNNLKAAQQQLLAAEDLIITDDNLEITLARQSLDKANQQLQLDQKNNPYVAGAPSDTVGADEDSVKSATEVLQNAQLKLQIDRSNKDKISYSPP